MTKDEALYRLAMYVRDHVARYDSPDLDEVVEALRPGPVCPACGGGGYAIVEGYYGLGAQYAPCAACEGRGWTA